MAEAAGRHVAKYEPLVEVITDKVNAEVPSPFEGILSEILAEEGRDRPQQRRDRRHRDRRRRRLERRGTAAPTRRRGGSGRRRPSRQVERRPSDAPAGRVRTGCRGSGRGRGPRRSSARRRRRGAGARRRPGRLRRAPTGRAAAAVAAPPASADPDARMTPAVRRLLREHGLTAAQIVGTGGGGRITREDVLAVVEAIRTGGAAPPAAAAAPATAPAAPRPPARTARGARAAAAPRPPAAAAAGAPIAFPDGADEVLLPMTQMRKGIAAQMTRALAGAARVRPDGGRRHQPRAAREAAKRDYQAKEGISLSYVPFVVKAAVEALKRNPTFNAHWTEHGLLAKRRINMGVAVAVDDGLLVPVIRDVDQLSINGLNLAIADVAARARASKLRIDDFGGGTFTVDNTGWLGTNLAMPIINVPEVAILTMEAITKRAGRRSRPPTAT